MHPKVLSTETWRLVRRLTAAGLLEGWILGGGTGLALQLGHRRSEDLDLFREAGFDVDRLIAGLSTHGRLEIQSRAPGTLHARLAGVRLSFLQAQAPLLFPGTPYRGLLVADARDIAVMKVVAIGGRGSRKDFIDLYAFLRTGGSLESVLQLVRRRFTGVDYNEYHLLKSLVFFEDAETEPMPDLLREVTWEEVKEALIAEVRRLS
jgi:hypothetical protein